MAYTEKQKEKAKCLFLAGKSTREIEHELEIRHTTIAGWAKKEGWEKGQNEQIIKNAVRSECEIMQLPTSQRAVVRKEITNQLEGMSFYQKSARKVAKKSLEALDADPTPKNAKDTMDALKTGMVVEGLVPYYPNATTINNTNAQQNNGLDEPPVINFIGVEGTQVIDG